MEKRKTGFILAKNKKGEWSWHLKARNGKIIAHGHGFNNKRNAKASIKAVCRMAVRYAFNPHLHNSL